MGHSAVVADDAWNVNLAEVVCKHLHSRHHWINPVVQRCEDWSLVGVPQFFVDVAGEQVASQPQSEALILHAGQVVPCVLDGFLKRTSEPEGSDLSVIGVDVVHLLGSDYFI